MEGEGIGVILELILFIHFGWGSVGNYNSYPELSILHQIKLML